MSGPTQRLTYAFKDCALSLFLWLLSKVTASVTADDGTGWRRKMAVPENGKIYTPGLYVLTGEYRPARDIALVVYCDLVTIDLNGHAIACGSEGSQTVGIKIKNGNRITVRNGKITQCDIGIQSSGASELTIEQIAFDAVHFIGVDYDGNGLVVRNCRFEDIAGYADEAYAIGVNRPGSNSLIEHCVFRNIERQSKATDAMQGEGVGIVVADGDRNCTIRRNWFENLPTDKPVSIGVFVSQRASARIEANTILDIPNAIGAQSPVEVCENVMIMRYKCEGPIAVHLEPGSTLTSNTMLGYTTPKLGGVDARDNRLENAVPSRALDTAHEPGVEGSS
ncbi:right-handed parallel beta-helix repeat-containing protein [Hwanghaeella sp.]|uniref:right-handed parallel beta-helix repeat-containing protein n=1 Tax=Hwanghaeella sp. TaxID=2605943 RepID=UPI003CCB7E24